MRAALLTIALGLSAASVPFIALGDEPALGTPVSQESLDAQRGGAEQVDNAIRVTGEVTDNTANNVTTGANNIQGGSFANASGINSVVQNTGANVLIQTATIVNVQFAEP
jgi:hypothetical protein